MSEWWTYSLSDFLMYSPRTYWRLVEHYNRALWPVHLLALAAGVAARWMAGSRSDFAGRALLCLLAVTWLWVGWAFHWQRYAEINWAARYVAGAFAVQAVLLAGFGLLRLPLAPSSGEAWRHWLGRGLTLSGLVLYPVIQVMAGRPWAQTEIFGMAPEPTALATLGLLLTAGALSGGSGRWVLALVPLLSLALGIATLWAMAG